MPIQTSTLSFAYTDEAVLLGMKKRGFGAGRWNGFGGKVGLDESIEDAAIREFQEEVALSVQSIEQRGTLRFHFEGDPVELEVHLFRVLSYAGEPRETEEMRPQWFRFDEIPYDAMWPDDRLWLPTFLAGKNVSGEFVFRGMNELLSSNVIER